ncbi:hypothetical protein K4K54_004855 [Colletotrichum sp. SAR 10_86]|nr:hypothetical protein KHU50_009484 [Colletotrichum sp. SAR 10_65]KAI8225080.1 hypothetical protein K4K54_004855 [Colletotrichum sp. SAR 10_86]
MMKVFGTIHFFFFFFLLLVLHAAVGVQAGSRQWSRNVILEPPHPSTNIMLDATGHAVADESTHERLLQKRYVAINGNGDTQRWPDRTISYCFANKEARTKLHEGMLEATQRWRHAGLSELAFKYKQVAEPGRACTNHPQRSVILVVALAEGFRAHQGIPNINANQENYQGPVMELSMRTDIGMLDWVGNIAHEIGHAWGLAHEHQNMNFWKRKTAEGDVENGYGSGDGALFSAAQFDCTALQDYETIHEQVKKDKPEDVPKLCTNNRIAKAHDFSAFQWLPDPSSWLNRQSTGRASGVSIDWKSIMLYPSGAGGIGSASPPGGGQPLDTNDRRRSVLVRRDRSTFTGNREPSEDDVKGIESIYKDENFANGEAMLPSDKKHEHFAKFKTLAKKVKCKLQGNDG